MRTERLILFGTHFFAYWNGHVFYTHGHSANFFVTPKFLPNFAMSKGNKRVSAHSFSSSLMA
jgi:hypothetical protein